MTAFLNSDPITILVQGNDSDAKRMFDSLNVSAVQVSASILKKEIQSPSSQISIGCNHSENTQTTSCTIKIKRDSNLEVSNEKKNALLASNVLEDTGFLFNRFMKNNDGIVPMYVSEKQDFAYSSSPDQFRLSYQQVSR